MYTQKNTTLPLLALGIIAVVFSILVFLFINIETPVFWVSYVFCLIAFGAQPLMARWILSKNAEQKQIFLGLPVLAFGLIYLVVQLVLGLVFMLLQMVDIKVAAAVQLVWLAIYFFIAIAGGMAKDYASGLSAQTAQKNFYVRNLLVDVQSMQRKAQDAALQKSLYTLAETIQYTDPMSHESLFALEGKIESKTAELGQMIDKGQSLQAAVLAAEVNDLFVQRNQKCKLLK